MTGESLQPVKGKCPLCGADWNAMHDLQSKVMEVMTTGSILALIVGGRGDGKTWFSCWLTALLVALPDYEWHVISNVVTGRFLGMRNDQRQDDPEALAEFERCDPPSSRIHFSTTLEDSLRIESELIYDGWKRGRKTHILWVLDEGPAVGFGSTATQQSVYNEQARSLYKLILLARKVQTSVAIIGVSEKMLSPKLRSEEDVGGVGLVRVVFSKWRQDIEAIIQQSHTNPDYLWAYDVDGIPPKQLVAVKVKDDPDFLSSLLVIGESSMTRDLRTIRKGQISYDTFAIAGFVLGEDPQHPGKPFSLDKLLEKLSDVHSSELPEIFFNYMHPKEKALKPEQQAALDEESESVSESEMSALEDQMGKEHLSSPDAAKDAPALLALQKQIDIDRLAWSKYHQLKYISIEALRKAAKVEPAQFNRLKHRLDFSYRNQAGKETDAA